MSLFQIAPLETIAAEGLTGLLIKAGAKGVATAIVKRAKAILNVVTAVSAIDSGDTVNGLTSLSSALATSDLDPGEALALQGVITQIATQASLLNSVLKSTLTGEIASTVYANIATGVEAACKAEIAKYGTPAPVVPVAAAAEPAAEA